MKCSYGAVLLLPLLGSLSTFAQDAPGLLALKVEAVKVPPLARQARLQGDVILRSGLGKTTVASGHPILAQAALENLKELGDFSDAEIGFVYHFILVEPEFRAMATAVKKGNRFTRFIRRAFRLKTEELVEYPQCVESPPPKNRISSTDKSIEVWIYGTSSCLQPQIALR